MFSMQTIGLLALTLVSGASAEFWLAKNSLSSSVPGPVDPSNGNWQFIFTPDIHNCDNNIHASLLNQRSDVSGDKLGVRIEWEDQGDELSKLVPLVAEWNTGSRHETWYADRNGDVFDLDGNRVGHCDADTSINLDCDMDLGSINLNSVLHCDFDSP